MDSDRIVNVEHGTELYRETVKLRHRVLREPLGLEFREEELAQESWSIHLALLREDQVVGCLVLVPMADHQVKMRQVAINSSYQSQGLGRKLIEGSEVVCRDLDAKEIILHARQEAVPFYIRLGYEAEGAEFLEVGIPHRFMHKLL